MPRLLFQEFLDGTIRIGSSLSVLDKDGVRTYFVGPDNYFSHSAGDAEAERFALATLMANAHVHCCEISRSPLGIPRRRLMNWTRQLEEWGLRRSSPRAVCAGAQ